jgi:uncharacterized protein
VCVTALAWLSAQPAPPPLTGIVNDFAHVIDAGRAADIERVSRALQAKTGDVIVVATIDTFAPYADIREYAVKLFENGGRGIGERGRDNGLLIVAAIRDRQVWTEVGYGLEEFITDGFAGEVARNDMAPAFRQEDYGGGLLTAVVRFARRIAERRNVTLDNLPAVAERPAAGPVVDFPVAAILLLFLFIALMSSLRPRRRRRYWGGTPWSGWNSGVGPFGRGSGGFGGGFGGFGGGSGGGGFGGFGGGRSGGGGGGGGW